MTDTKPEKTTVGVVMTPELKQKLNQIADQERRSLSGQIEFFLRNCVEQTATNTAESEVRS